MQSSEEGVTTQGLGNKGGREQRMNTYLVRAVVSGLTLLGLSSATFGQVVVAGEDFDGAALNLTNSVVPTLDGGPGDFFGVGSRNAWPQGFPNLRFGSLADHLADITPTAASGGKPDIQQLVD